MNKDNTKEDNRLIKKKIYFSLYSLEDTLKQLEDLAKEGLLLEKVVGMSYYFKRVEPCSVKYSIEAFSKASNYDTIPAKTTSEFIEYCEEVGWNYICSSGKYQFFYSTDENVVPIETDASNKLNNIVKIAFIPELISDLAFLFIFGGVKFIMMLFNPGIINFAEIFINDLVQYQYLYLLFILLAILACVKFAIFYRRNKKRVNMGLDIQYYSKKTDKKFFIVSIGMAIIFSVIYIDNAMFNNGGGIITLITIVVMALFLIVFFVLNNIRVSRLKLSRTGNKLFVIGISAAYVYLMMFVAVVLIVALTVWNVPLSKNEVKVKYYDEKSKSYKEEVIEQSKLKLTRKDLGYVDEKEEYIESMLENNKTIFGEYYRATEEGHMKNSNYGNESLDYIYVKSDYKFILDSFVNSYVRYNEYSPYNEVDKNAAKEWKANKVYKISEVEDIDSDLGYDLLVVYDDCVLYIYRGSNELIQNNIDVIYNKLVK